MIVLHVLEAIIWGVGLWVGWFMITRALMCLILTHRLPQITVRPRPKVKTLSPPRLHLLEEEALKRETREITDMRMFDLSSDWYQNHVMGEVVSNIVGTLGLPPRSTALGANVTGPPPNHMHHFDERGCCKHCGYLLYRTSHLDFEAHIKDTDHQWVQTNEGKWLEVCTYCGGIGDHFQHCILAARTIPKPMVHTDKYGNQFPRWKYGK